MHEMQQRRRVGVVGARSQVGVRVLAALAAEGRSVSAFTRQDPARQSPAQNGGDLTWCGLSPGDAGANSTAAAAGAISDWIFVAHIWALPDCFDMLEAFGAQRLVAVSSTSRFTKPQSSDAAERNVARKLADAEAQVQDWATRHGVAWTILRPTLIYGGGQDRNISEMASVIRRFGAFPLLGRAVGLRQPVHVEDVAAACVSALSAAASANRAYNISGGEILTYRAMATRVFEALGRKPRFLPIPLWTIRAGVGVMRALPRYRHVSAGMAERMNTDMVFEHADAARDFGFQPRPFGLTPRDMG